MHVITYINVNLNIGIPFIAKKESFGHYILTNVGTLGIQQAFAPLCPPMKSIGLTCTGTIRKMPVVVDGELKVQSVMTTSSTGDHRFGDASVFIPLQRCFTGYMSDPANFDHTAYKENLHYSERDAIAAAQK